jgi:hypothetical protein
LIRATNAFARWPSITLAWFCGAAPNSSRIERTPVTWYPSRPNVVAADWSVRLTVLPCPCRTVAAEMNGT